jgi:hypothetical protein
LDLHKALYFNFPFCNTIGLERIKDKDERLKLEMEEKSKEEGKPVFYQEAYEILTWASTGEDITIRDEQYAFPWIIDSVRRCRKRGFRFRLIDSGQLSCPELEWIAEAGADIYSSEKARPEAFELELLSKACRRGKAFLAYFHKGTLETEVEEERTHSLSFSDLQNLGVSGIYLHMSNKKEKRDFSYLNSIAFTCKKGGSWLVYYHHGPLETSLAELARNGAWIHVSDKGLNAEEDLSNLLEIIKVSRSAGTNLVLHLEKGLDILTLKEIIRAGAFVLFKFSLFDRQSPFHPLEKAARKKKLNFRAFYLFTHFLP